MAASNVSVPVHASANGLPPAGHKNFPINANMANAVQVYLNTVRNKIKRMGPHAKIKVKRQFSLNWLIGFNFNFKA